MQKRLLSTALLPLLAVMAMPAQAVDLTWSGFGTFGYARSDQSFNYQRFISDDGTLKRDTVLGAQVDARFSQEWSATVQAKAAPSDHSDSQWQASVAWAFLSWRPSDDWLIRAGKIRLPMMLNTENSDVGATYDFARLPLEVYSIAPTTDVIGVSISKTWLGDSFDWTAEAYTGETSTYWRYYGRDRTMDKANSPGSWFLPIDMKSSGLVLTARSFEHTFRIGYHEGQASRPGEKTGAGFEYLNPPGVYLLSSGGVDKLRVPIVTLGASVSLPVEFRLTGEYAQAKVESASRGLSRWGAYLALTKRIGAWTPYVSYAKTKSTDEALGLYQRINANAGVVPAPLRNSQTLMADITAPYDQSTIALGTSFAVSPKSLIKTEISRVRTGVASSFIDAPAGGDSGNRHINIFSLSYSFSF
ncbi:MAG: hypothetical protein H6R13_2708 [Proteobacteria bacterium]|nr:hypothetical protein [Pseudomonadota bacterium]